jgi:hypothetical protein
VTLGEQHVGHLRIGWVDEAISPFTRRQREVKAKPKIREAA